MNRKYRKTVIAGNWKMNKTPSETKEFMTESDTFRSTFDETGDISHDKAASVSQIYDTLHGIQSCKMIIGDLWFCIAHSGEQSGFSYVRKTNQSYISNDLQLQIDPEFLSCLTRLSVFWYLHGSCCIVHVSLTTAASL